MKVLKSKSVWLLLVWMPISCFALSDKTTVYPTPSHLNTKLTSLQTNTTTPYLLAKGFIRVAEPPPPPPPNHGGWNNGHNGHGNWNNNNWNNNEYRGDREDKDPCDDKKLSNKKPAWYDKQAIKCLNRGNPPRKIGVFISRIFS